MKGLKFHPEKCLGCKSCVLACSFHHHREYSIPHARLKISSGAKRKFSDIQICKQCEERFCLEACPVEAITVDSEGICDIDSESCIGCGACVEACVYEGIWMNANTETAVKCNLCSGSPACVAVCIPKALAFTEKA